MMKLILLQFFLLATIWSLSAMGQIPCDEAYGEYCPSSSSWEVGECLKKLQPPPPEACLKYIEMNDICKSDIETNCAGMEYSGDLKACLFQWTAPEKLSADCLALAPKVEKKERKLSQSEKKKADARRKVRKQAAKLAREF